MVKTQEFINNRHKYKVDRNYQRPANAWSLEDKQCLIDTILRDEPMPLFFLNYVSEKGIYFIVDGQQRLNAISDFYDNKIKLSRKFSDDSNHGKTFNGVNPIADEQRRDFLDYQLNFKLLENYNDERIRLIFSRLQRGRPLQLGERLNAKPGQIVNRMRELANHKFLKKSVGAYKERYGIYPDAARMLFYEKHGPKQCGSNELYNFFENNPNITKNDKDFKNAISNLNFLAECFPPDPGNYKYLEKHAWISAVYIMIKELRLFYFLYGFEKKIRKFIEEFHGKVYSAPFRDSKRIYARFYENVRGGWSEKIIKLRRDILIQEFLKEHNLAELSDRRQISNEEKIAAYHDHPFCEMCFKKFKDYRKAEYHHHIHYSKAGPTDISNIKVLCAECHSIVHGKGKIKPLTEDEIDTNNDFGE